MIFTSFIKNGKGHGKRWLLLYSLILIAVFYFYLPFMLMTMPPSVKKSIVESIEVDGNEISLNDALDQHAVIKDENGEEVTKVFPIELKDGELISPKAHSKAERKDKNGNLVMVILDTINENVDTAELTQKGIIFGRKSLTIRSDKGHFLTLNYPKDNVLITKEKIIDGTAIDEFISFFIKMGKENISSGNIPFDDYEKALRKQGLDIKILIKTLLLISASIIAAVVFIVSLIVAFILSLFIEPLSTLLKMNLDDAQSKRLSALAVIFESILSLVLMPYVIFPFLMGLLLTFAIAIFLMYITHICEKA